MAITLTTDQPYPGGFTVVGNSSDLTGCEELLAAPGEGKSIYLASVTATTSSGLQRAVTIGAGASAGAVETVIVGPLYLLSGSPGRVSFPRPVQLPANKSLTVDASNAASITVVVEGFIQ